jgi:hypothetical protein
MFVGLRVHVLKKTTRRVTEETGECNMLCALQYSILRSAELAFEES